MIIREPQVFEVSTYPGHCPYCGSAREKSQGELDIPPIWLQTQDIRRGIKRTWRSERHFCENCLRLFDVLIVNTVTGAEGR